MARPSLGIFAVVALFTAALTAATVGLCPYRPAASDCPLPPAVPERSFRGMLRAAWQHRTHARLAVSRELEAIDEWDPNATAGMRAEQFRRELLARDPQNDLRRSLALAQQAAAMAATAGDRYRAVALLARVQCDRGDHEAELRQAQVLMSLAPGAERSQVELQHARRCCDEESAARLHPTDSLQPGYRSLVRTVGHIVR